MRFSNEAMRDVLMFIEKNQQYCGAEEEKRLTTYAVDMIVGAHILQNCFLNINILKMNCDTQLTN